MLVARAALVEYTDHFDKLDDDEVASNTKTRVFNHTKKRLISKMSQNVRNAAQHPSTNSNTIANNQNNNSSILNFFSVTDDSQLVSSMDTINQMGGRRDSDINSLSYTHVPIMPDLYLPYGELEKCPEIQLLPKDETDADACKALISKRKERRAKRKEKREKLAIKEGTNDSVSFLSQSQIDGA